MTDYIKREDAIEEFEHRESYSATYIRGFLKHLPSADVAPVRHGRWLDCEWESGFKFVCCSECKRSDMDSRFYNYCPHCGAKMDEEVEA